MKKTADGFGRERKSLNQTAGENTFDLTKLINAVRGSEAAQVLFEYRIRPEVEALAVTQGRERPLPLRPGQ